MKVLKKIFSKITHAVKIPVRTLKKSRALRNFWFAYTHRQLRRKRKILYALTPPSRLGNVGDHAQAIAIRAWLKKHFPELPVIEMDKDQTTYYLPVLRWLIQPGDVLFLQSGGNLGDRYMWSESGRRLLINSFPKNQIVSLPQTIYFSDTPTGNKERENSRRIYATHPNLTIMARDPQSAELAKDLFPGARIFCMPDFALSLPSTPCDIKNDPPRVLLCLRTDKESILTEGQRKEIADRLPYQSTYFNTISNKRINIIEQVAVLEMTLDPFRASDVVVTDRFHGLIFAVLCQKPCVILPSVDHKLTSAMYWFKDMPFVMLAQNLDEVPSLIERCLTFDTSEGEFPDWNAKYFDKLPELIGLQ